MQGKKVFLTTSSNPWYLNIDSIENCTDDKNDTPEKVSIDTEDNIIISENKNNMDYIACILFLTILALILIRYYLNSKN